MDMLAVGVTDFSASWLDIAKGGIGAVFLSLFTWLVTCQIPKMHADMILQGQRFAESISGIIDEFRIEQAAARDTFRREQDALRKANALQHEQAIIAFESALREICNRQERADERVMNLLNTLTADHSR